MLVLAPLRSASAEPLPAARSTLIVLLPETGATEALGALRAQLSDLPVTLVFGPSPGSRRDLRAATEQARVLAERHHALSAVWLDLDGSGTSFFYLIEPSGERILVRQVRDVAHDAAALEQLGLIARGWVTALLDGASIDLVSPTKPPPPPPSSPPAPPPASPSSAPPPAAPPPAVLLSTPPPGASETPRAEPVTERAARLAIALGYVGSTFANTVPWQSGLRLSLTWRVRPYLHVTAGYVVFGTLHVQGSGSTIELSRHPVEAGVERELRFGALALTGGLLAVLDPTTRSTVQTVAGLAPTPDRTVWLAGFAPRLRAELTVRTRVRLFAGAGADVLCNGVRYTVQSSVGPLVVSPWVARPRLDTGLAVDLW